MNLFKEVEEKLKELDISYQLVEHEPAVTIELADKFIEGIEGVRTKTMFLTNRKKRNFYLMILDDSKRLDMDKFKDIVEEKQIKLASEDTLYEKMMLVPGVVSPFGLLNNVDKDVKVYFDREIVHEERMSFHPNTNEKTIFLKTPDVFKFIESIGYTVNIIDI
ncbi:MAG: prolyl-tRNA synthetase associated domain-containing protein [Peptoniphilus sp.]|nr:prolyl-tRNA synthetase associated domain-containing protein [Peptoniphilus sp.]